MMTHNIITHMMEQGSLEWFNLRVGMVTASKFSDIVKNGKSGNESKMKLSIIDNLTTEILINQKLDFGQTFAMREGVEFEPFAKKAYELKTFNTIQKVGFIQIENYYIGCSPDGLIGSDGGIELKCPQPKAHFKYLNSDEAPEEYIHQIQGCMWVTGRKWWDFVSFNNLFPEKLQLKMVRVHRDEEMIKKISEQAYAVEFAVRQNVKKYLINV